MLYCCNKTSQQTWQEINKQTQDGQDNISPAISSRRGSKQINNLRDREPAEVSYLDDAASVCRTWAWRLRPATIDQTQTRSIIAHIEHALLQNYVSAKRTQPRGFYIHSMHTEELFSIFIVLSCSMRARITLVFDSKSMSVGPCSFTTKKPGNSSFFATNFHTQISGKPSIRRDLCHISHHTCNASLHYLCYTTFWKKRDSKILTYLTHYHRSASSLIKLTK